MADIITFKLEDKWAAMLEAKVPKGKKTSRHLVAKHIVIHYLEDSERQKMKKEMANLRLEVKRLRKDLGTAVKALLVKGGQIKDPEEAENWADRIFL